MALTTLQFWQQQQTLYQQAQAVAQNDLGTAQKTLKTVGDTLAEDLKALDKVDKGIAENRAKLAATTIPAETNALVEKLTAAIIEQRHLQGKVLDDREAMDEARASLDSAAARLSRIKLRTAAIQTGLAQATADDAQRQALRLAVNTAPLSTLQADAANWVTTAATNGVKKNFPDEIIGLAGLRYQTRNGRLKALQDSLWDAQDALGTEIDADGGLQGQASRTRLAFQHAQDELARYVATAADRYQKAKVLMQWLATNPDILTAAEHAQAVLPANATPGAAAAGLADALATAAQTAVDQAAADRVAALQAAVAEQAAKKAFGEAILAAGEAAEIAARPGATPADETAADNAANDAVTARNDANDDAADRVTAEAAAAASAAAARTAIAAAAPSARTLGLCLEAVYGAEAALDTGILAGIDTDVDEINGDPAVLKTERDTVTAARATHQGARTAFAAAGRNDLDRWEAIIPDPAWKVLLDYQEGLAALGELKNIDPAALVTAMDTAEDAHAKALAAAALAERKADALGDAIALRGQRLGLARAALAARLPSAIRGDSD